MTVYWDDSHMADEYRMPDVLAEGDSWSNELRPNRQGYRKLAARFRKTLLSHLP